MNANKEIEGNQVAVAQRAEPLTLSQHLAYVHNSIYIFYRFGMKQLQVRSQKESEPEQKPNISRFFNLCLQNQRQT